MMFVEKNITALAQSNQKACLNVKINAVLLFLGLFYDSCFLFFCFFYFSY